MWQEYLSRTDTDKEAVRISERYRLWGNLLHPLWLLSRRLGASHTRGKKNYTGKNRWLLSFAAELYISASLRLTQSLHNEFWNVTIENNKLPIKRPIKEPSRKAVAIARQAIRSQPHTQRLTMLSTRAPQSRAESRSKTLSDRNRLRLGCRLGTKPKAYRE